MGHISGGSTRKAFLALAFLLGIILLGNPTRALAVCAAPGSPDGDVEAGEQCDDGNLVNDDACTNACNNAVCGDGIIKTTGTAEICDDGAQNGTGPGKCNTACTRIQSCGDSFKDGTEACDTGGNSATCDANCTLPACGDGNTNGAAGETCDDGAQNGTGPGECNSACTRVQTCGDSFTDGTEACDGGGGNTASCDANCTLPACGDGNINGAAGENCEDGNTNNANGTSDTCDSNCKTMACGNGITSYKPGPTAEQCDDGNTTNGDDCDQNCVIEGCGNGQVDQGETCDSGVNNGTGNGFCLSDCSAIQSCGNSIKNGTEECDTGGNTATCDSNCTLPVCGDGNTNGAAGETCDDGNTNNANGSSDTCDGNCKTWACGNGVVSYRPGPVAEQCDFGDTTNGDGCDANCKIETCGDGVIDSGEACDQGDLNGTGNNKCLDDCSAIQVCANNFVQGTEDCEVGPAAVNTASCDTDCSFAECGDGFANTTADEDCDDGNVTNNDGCDANCTLPSCGNGVISFPEECDDGNQQIGDGCAQNCVIEDCGNGQVEVGEACDHGNLNGTGNGKCLADCSGVQFCSDQVVNGTEECETTVGDTAACDSDCTLPECGDVHTNALAGEQCDQANNVDGDGCDTNCKVTACGNGIVTFPEECDVGDVVVGDGCNATCKAEQCGNLTVDAGEVCDWGPWNGFGDGFCLEDCSGFQVCGDALVQGTEECDDFNVVNNDGCDNNCMFTGCGNGELTVGEVCDDGNTDPANGTSDLCDSNCLPPSCGNQVVSITANAGPNSPQEVCDDGNNVSNDGCRADCLAAESCGDGVQQGGAPLSEQCDDGNVVSGDNCDAACKLEDCGNGNKTLNEQCDDGNLLNTDGCIITSTTAGQDPAGPTNCALATCGDGFVQAGVEPCDGGGNCTPSCCVYLPGYQIGILGAQCQEELLKTECDYSMCGRASYIQKQIDRYDDQLEKIERQIEEARLNGAARRAANLARKLGRMEVKLSRYCPESLEAQNCLRDLMDELGDVLAPLEDNLLLVNP